MMEMINASEHDRPSRRDLTIHVVPLVAKNWIGLGEMLLDTNLVDSGYLEMINKNNPGDAANCCRQMFIRWLETDKIASWKQLIIALQCPGVQLDHLAEQIKKKLQKDKGIENSTLTEFDAAASGKEADLIYNVGDKKLGEEAADQIARHLFHKIKLQELYLYNNNFKTIGIIKIAKGLQNISTLRVFSIGCNNVGEEAADDVATILSHNSRLTEIYLYNNNFKTAGMIRIAQALQGISTLTAFSIGENNIGEGAADDIATVLSGNTNLSQLHLHNNNFKTVGIIKIAKALQNISTLTIFSIGDNNVNEEAADDIASILSHNRKLKELYLHNNNFKTKGLIKIAKSLKNTVTLTVLSIGDNQVGDEAADDIATVLSQNTQLQELHLHNNNIQARGAIKITKALINTSMLVKYNISHNNIDGRTVGIVKNILSWNTELNLCM